ncbi:Family S53 protease-like protein [Mycena indigotica]|uniref:Family S53 protease-like protein n=1 Tax=Mycena indigotica TaxID=2126181 RepID=A0A8H6S507_9AGAR|nr:Family S53 protease-like protein [Mycena indigotica]KAF7293014.1 Family S53 protease-like protein [Mycena indigotica]
MILSFSLLAAFIGCAAASPGDSVAMVVHEQRARPARGFVNIGPAPDGEQLHLRIALHSNDFAGLEDELYAVSDPSSPRYGQHLTQKQVARYIKPSDDSLAAVTSWLRQHEISAVPISPAGDILQIQITVSQANSLFNAQFSSFSHPDINGTTTRTLQYSLPANLSPHISYIHPATSFSTPFAMPKSRPAPTKRDGIDPSCADLTTISCVLAEYGIPTTPATQSSNVLGVSGFINQFANFLDLRDFLTQFRPDISPTTKFDVQLLDGGANTQVRQFAGTEASLDIQYTVGLAAGVPVRFISVGLLNNDDAGGFLDQINALINSTSRPTVLSTSYGFGEDDLTLPVAEGLCKANAQLGAMGTSVLLASGDGGVAGRSFDCTTFKPTAPSNCPWVTSVGGSQIILENFTKDNMSEIGASFSSGGFSNHFKTPRYQRRDVEQYIANLNGTYDGLYNPSGRGFPDVSAQSVNFEIIVNDQAYLVSGTSAAVPVFASVISFLNDELITAGRRPLGFLNPFLYSPIGRAALNDITVGRNPGCGTSGFSAGTGWDPVTGLGSPNYTRLRKAVGLRP